MPLKPKSNQYLIVKAAMLYSFILKISAHFKSNGFFCMKIFMNFVKFTFVYFYQCCSNGLFATIKWGFYCKIMVNSDFKSKSRIWLEGHISIILWEIILQSALRISFWTSQFHFLKYKSTNHNLQVENRIQQGGSYKYSQQVSSRFFDKYNHIFSMTYFFQNDLLIHPMTVVNTQ